MIINYGVKFVLQQYIKVVLEDFTEKGRFFSTYKEFASNESKGHCHIFLQCMKI